MKRGLLSPEVLADSHNCAIALRRRMRFSLISNLFKPAPYARVLAFKKPLKEAA